MIHSQTFISDTDWDAVATKVTGWVSTAWTTISTTFSTAATTISTWFSNTDWSVVATKVSGWASSAWSTISTTFSGAATTISGWFTSGVDWSGLATTVSSWASTAWTNITSALGGLGTWLSNLFSGANQQVVNAGSQVTKGISSGMTNANSVSSLKNASSDVIGTVVKSAKDKAKIKSPSQVMRDEVGKYLSLGMAEGIEDYAYSVDNAMSDIMSIPEAYDFGSTSPVAFSHGTSGLSGAVINININGANYTNEQSLAEAISEELQNLMDRERAVFA